MKQHLNWIDTARVMAMFILVCCHCADPFNFYAGDDPAMQESLKYWGGIYGAALRPCVPLFVMITGALLLPVKEDFAPFCRKRISRVFFPFVIWSVLYNLFPFVANLLGDGEKAIEVCFPYAAGMSLTFGAALERMAMILVNFNALDVHMWYIYMLIGLYLYMPIFSAWVEKASLRAKWMFAGAWGLSLFLPYANELFAGGVWGECSWNAFGTLYYFAGFNGYLLLGHLLRHTELSLSKTLLLAVVCLPLGYATTYVGFEHMRAIPDATEPMIELFFTFCSPNVLLLSFPLFLLAKKIRVGQGLQRLFANLQPCGFGIYMVHYFFVGPAVLLVQKAGVPMGLQILVAGLLAFAASWILIYFLRPLLGRSSRIVLG